MTSTRRPQARAVRSLHEVLAAARALFAELGVDDVTIDDVAARAGRTKGSVYYHFASKVDLFEAVFLSEHRRLVDAVQTTTEGLDPETALRSGLATYLRLVAADAVAAGITLVQAPTVLGWHRWRECDGGTFRTSITAALVAAREAGRSPSEADPEIFADLLLGAVSEAAVAVARDDDSEGRAVAVIYALNRLLDGIFRAAG